MANRKGASKKAN